MSSEKLLQAVQNGNLDEVRALLDAGADIDTRVEGNETLLHVAADKGHVEIARLLIDRGIDINAVSEYGQSAISNAAMFAHLDMVIMLLDRGADPNAASEASTALHWCAEWGLRYKRVAGTQLSETEKQVFLDIAKRLVAAGADPNLWDHEGDQPLHLALAEAPIELARVLLDAGADLNKPGRDGALPLHIVESSRELDKIRLLLERGADPKATTEGRWSPARSARDSGDAELLALFGDAADDLPPPDEPTAPRPPGFDGVTRGFLLAGRTIDAELTPEQLEELVAITARWAERLGQPLECVPSLDASPETGGLEPGEAFSMMVTIGLVVAEASAEPGGWIPDSIGIDKLRNVVERAAELPAALWRELASASQTGHLVESEDALWLVSCGPLAAASLVFGTEADDDGDSELELWHAVDQEQERMIPAIAGTCVVQVSYDGSSSAESVDLSDDAHADRLAATAAIDSASRGYYLLVRFD